MPIKLTDIFVILIAVAASIFFLLRPQTGDFKRLTLIHGDEKILLPYLDGIVNLKEYTGKNMLLEIVQGKARITHSDCPDKICVKSGFIDKCGEALVCMPNETAVIIECRDKDYENK